MFSERLFRKKSPEPKQSSETLYVTEKKEIPHLSLTEEQRNAVRSITLGIEEVDESIRSVANEDVAHTIENGHPLNRLITDADGMLIGYIACEDFIPHEAYIKYFGTTGTAGRNLLAEIPVFLEYAKEQGYAKISFHGWNDRLNRVLERYGFARLRTDTAMGFSVDFYEKELVPRKDEVDVDEERKRAFEQKYLNKISQEYQQTLTAFPDSVRREKEQAIMGAYHELSGRLAGQVGFEFGERQQTVLKLKLARYFQNYDTCDTSTLFDAIVETPKFINTDKGSLYRLLEVHEEKTAQKIAEIRKKRAEMGDTEAYNPYENLFTTTSGDHYMARLLNMPHLEEESEYMDHCVGTSDSYVNRIKRGDIEILSFRAVPKVNPASGKLEGDIPIMTIEYDLKTKTIRQMKKKSDAYLDPSDPYFEDVIDALKRMRETKTDMGEPRDFLKISESELGNINVADYHILTEHGEVSFRDFDPTENAFVLKMGRMEITPDTPKTDAAKILKIVEHIDCMSEEIAYGANDINERTKVYIGEWTPGIMYLLPEGVTDIYEQFPEKKVFMRTVETDPTIRNADDAIKKLEAEGYQLSDWTKGMLKKVIWSGEKQSFELVSFSVKALGFPGNATYADICKKAKEIGLDLVPEEAGPAIRRAYPDQSSGDYFRVAMNPIADADGNPALWYVDRVVDGRWLDCDDGRAAFVWDPDGRFVFLRRKSSNL